MTNSAKCPQSSLAIAGISTPVSRWRILKLANGAEADKGSISIRTTLEEAPVPHARLSARDPRLPGGAPLDGPYEGAVGRNASGT